MDLKLKDKVFVVSGGGAGIGGAISKTLLKEGAKLAIVGRSNLSAEISREFSDISEDFRFFQTQLCDEQNCKESIEKIVKEFGQIDGLVNNAGVNDNVHISSSVDEFRASLEKNLVHYFTMMHYCLPYLEKSQGSVVNIGSKTAFTGQGQTSGYAAANGGRVALTREWAAALLDKNIRVNCVIPAEVMTPLYKRWIESFDNSDKKLEEITSKIPLGKRMTSQEEIANMVVFLLSKLSSHTTGQIVFVDGGYTHLDRALS